MKIEGSCHCGKIGYEAEINPEYVIICHCTDCQTVSGGPYRANVPVKIENFKLRGQPKTYVKTADSGNKMALSFCADCGSALYSSVLEKPPCFQPAPWGGEAARAAHSESPVLVPLGDAVGHGYQPHPTGSRPDPTASDADKFKLTHHPLSTLRPKLLHSLVPCLFNSRPTS